MKNIKSRIVYIGISIVYDNIYKMACLKRRKKKKKKIEIPHRAKYGIPGEGLSRSGATSVGAHLENRIPYFNTITVLI